MPIYSLDGDTTGLPKTRRTAIPYEMDALGPRETWGAGNGSTAIPCRQRWDTSASWIREMVGEVQVVRSTGGMSLRRYVPEPLRYNEAGDGADLRVQFCSMIDQIDQGGNASDTNLAQVGTGWPETDWCRYRAVWEVFPYAILDDAVPLGGLPSVSDVAAGAGALAGARELYRYVIRSRRTYSREQPVPAASAAGGFKDTTTGKPIGQVGFVVTAYADVQYKWVRVPVGWPPPVGYLGDWPFKFNPAALAPATNLRTRDSFVGTINDDWFDCAAPDGYAHPPGTLLYLGYDDSNRYYDAAGDWVCDVVFSFKQKRAVDNVGGYGGWNYFLNAQGKWVLVSLDGTTGGIKPYKTNAFNSLFQWN